MEKRKIILLILIIALVIMGIAAALYFWPAEYKNFAAKEYAQCISQNEMQYAKLMAKKTGDESYCAKDGIADNACIAYARRSPEIYCSTQSEGGTRDSCYAEILQDQTKCPPDDNWCLAYASDNPEYCQRLEDQSSKKECIMSLTQNADYWISSEAKKECKDASLFAAAAMLKDPRACRGISKERKQECLKAAELKFIE